MGYQRLEVNLLPPELQPGPAVRLGLVGTIFLIVATVAFIAVDSFTKLASLHTLGSHISEQKEQLVGLAPLEQEYGDLKKIEARIDEYGRLVNMASIGYFSLPLALDRVSKILPDGVYLISVTNDKPDDADTTTVLKFLLKASRRDEALVNSTLRAFKGDPLFADCYLRYAQFMEQSLDPLREQYDIDWSASGPDVPENLLADEYEFEIQALMPKHLDVQGVPVIFDNSRYFEAIPEPPPPAPTDKEIRDARRKGKANDKDAASKSAEDAGARPAPEPAAGVEGAPEGVKPAEVH